jgi:biopolymer transport protein ExbB
MKNAFNTIVIVLSMAITFSFFYIVMGDASRFEKTPDGKPDYASPKKGDTLGTIYTGGPLVAVLMGFVLIATTFVFERELSIRKARGTGKMEDFIKKIQTSLVAGNVEEALSACDKQRGSLANVIREGLNTYNLVKDDNRLDPEKKMLEVKRAIDESTNLETPLLEKNLVVLSTIASIATMVGLLGTTLGMIKAFSALGGEGGISASKLSVAISEALYNTAGGLAGAVIAIIAYNYFTTKVDNFVYLMDEAVMSVTEILTIKVKK